MFKRFSAGFAVGYVMGARAGEKRYDQITGLAEKAMAIPGVDRVTEQASGLLTADNGRRILGSVVERARSGVLSSHRETSSSEEDGDEDDDGGWDDEQDDYEDEDVQASEGSEDDGPSDDEAPDDGESRDYEDSAGDEDESGEDEADEADEGETAGRHRNGSKPSRSSRRTERPRRITPGPERHGGRIRGLASAAIERGRVD